MMLHAYTSQPRLQIGTVNYWFLRFPFVLPAQNIHTHKHVMGLTGTGKSKLLAHLAASLLLQGIPIGVIDPHTDLTQDILGLLIERGYFNRDDAFKKLLYIDCTRADRFLPFNVLDQPYDPYSIARNLVEVCFRVWPSLSEGNAPLFETIMLACLPVLVANHLPLTALEPLLTNKAYREQLLCRCDDPRIISFFRNRVDQWKQTSLHLESTLNRATLLTYPPLIFMLGQEQNILNFPKLLSTGTSVICNLGGLDEQTQKILGCLLTVGFEQAALSRATMAEEKRTPYHLIFDEFTMFATQKEETLTRILTLCRKYKVFLTLAHQDWSQVGSSLKGAMQNTLPIFFRLGYDDAKWAAPWIGEFDPYQVKHVSDSTDAKELRSLPNFPEQYEVWTKELTSLRPREAYIRLEKRVKLRTLAISFRSSTAAAVAQIKDRYANLLLVSKDRIHTQVVSNPGSRLSRTRYLPKS
jgi:hypothetical protein